MPKQSYKERYPVAFPTLTPEQMAIVAEVGVRQTYPDGAVLFQAGEVAFKFLVLLQGEIAILDHSGGTSQTVLVHYAGEFTGDLANLAGRSSNVEAVARGTVEVYEISGPELRLLLQERVALSETLLNAFIARSRGISENNFTGLRLIGSQYAQDTFRLRDFMAKNRVLFTWIDPEKDPHMEAWLSLLAVGPGEMPIVASGTQWLLRNPSNLELADRLGIRQTFREEVYDLVIVGAGPAGLAAAVYGASEGLKTVVLERLASGGQAGTSSRIENYLGFPAGVSGSELAARATLQAEKFGAHLSIPSRALSITFEDNYKVLSLEEGESITTKALLIASGADYRRLPLADLARFEGAGVYYAATAMELQLCDGGQVVVVGGGNSAGQAAVFLSANVRKVLLVIRGEGLGQTMSRYLAGRIDQTSNIELLTGSEITGLRGHAQLEAVEVTHHQNGVKREVPVTALFSFIGAVPRTAWLPASIERDAKNFLLTGSEVSNLPGWELTRPPLLLETSQAGVFAAGDVRSGSVKRVASAVGEGAMAVQFAHEYLKNF
jgi:thioredoxin reductase (NADPH)